MTVTTSGYVGIIRGVAVGSYGQVINITVKDLDGNAQNLSAYTGTKTAIAVSPDKRTTRTATISFSSDGSDGIVTFSWASTDIDQPGMWEVQLVFNAAAARVKTFIAEMPVLPGLQEDA